MSDNLKTFVEKKNDAKMEGSEHILELQSTGHKRLLLTQLAELRHDSQLCDVILVAKEYCCEFLKKELHPLNCLRICAFADTYACRELLCYSYQYILDHFQEVVDTEEFHLLPAEQVIELISNEELRVVSEEKVFEAVIQWVSFDLTARKPFLPQLLEQVRLPLCCPKFLVDTVSEVDLVMEDINASSRGSKDMQGLRIRPRNPIKYSEVLYVVGGWGNGQTLDSVERLDPKEPNPSWQPVASMTKKRARLGVAVLDNLLYAIGGRDEEKVRSSIERYDPATKQWSSDVATMLARREYFGLAALDGFLYAVGGFDGWGRLDSVERYDIRQNEWTRVAPLGSCRDGLSVSVLNGCLYAVGGSYGNACSNIVERLDPRKGKWQVVRPISTARWPPGTAVLDGNLYAAGGYDGSFELSSVEKYDPLTNEWTAVAAMNCKRSAVRLAVVNGMMYAVGGDDRNAPQDTIEVYDPKANQWSLHSIMSDKRYRMGVLRMP